MGIIKELIKLVKGVKELIKNRKGRRELKNDLEKWGIDNDSINKILDENKVNIIIYGENYYIVLRKAICGKLDELNSIEEKRTYLNIKRINYIFFKNYYIYPFLSGWIGFFYGRIDKIGINEYLKDLKQINTFKDVIYLILLDKWFFFNVFGNFYCMYNYDFLL